MKKKYVRPKMLEQIIVTDGLLDIVSINTPLNPTVTEVKEINANISIGYGGGYTGSGGAHSREGLWGDEE